MSALARLKQTQGGNGGDITTIASATTTVVPDEQADFIISGSATITSLQAALATRGRRVTFIGASGAAVVFTNSDDTTTANQMDLGGSDITLGANDVLELKLMAGGYWIRLYNTNN